MGMSRGFEKSFMKGGMSRNMSEASTHVGLNSSMDRSFSSMNGSMARSPSSFGREQSTQLGGSSMMDPEGFSMKKESSLTTYKRQKMSFQMVSDTMFKMLELDQAMEFEKEHLWQNGLNAEAAFTFLDRYGKGYISDTDIWQILHTDTPVTLSGVCQLFRELKTESSKKNPGKLSLAELTRFVFPRQSEEWQHMKNEMDDNEALSVLFVVRSTVSCPGCQSRVQRTIEGCPSVTCAVCRTAFRCNLIGDDRDQKFVLSLTQKQMVRDYLKFAIETGEEMEKMRKNLLYEADSLSTVLLDAFLFIADDKGFISFYDFKKALLGWKCLKESDMQMLWDRFAEERHRIGFVEFAQQLRPFGTTA